MMKMMRAMILAAVALSALVAANPRPTVIWHGMGDTCCLPFSMGAVKKEIEATVPGIYVNSIMLGENQIEDEFMDFFANMNTQVDKVCTMLKADPKLADGFNAIGFSQGGQFLRAYVERCNDPPVHNLVTMGGQHMGVAEIPDCVATNMTICEDVAKLLTLGAYADGVRDWQVQAQYFRSPYNMTAYRERNIFLADINNEREQKNATYKENLVSLNKLVLVKFAEDTTVIPRESEWFGAFAEGAESTIVPMRNQSIYTEDWIGLQELDKRGDLIEASCPGNHMQFTLSWLKNNMIIPYLNNTI